MGTLEKGITSNGAGYAGQKWNILGQVYYPKATCDAALLLKRIPSRASTCQFMFMPIKTSLF